MQTIQLHLCSELYVPLYLTCQVGDLINEGEPLRVRKPGPRRASQIPSIAAYSADPSHLPSSQNLLNTQLATFQLLESSFINTAPDPCQLPSLLSLIHMLHSG